MEYKNGKQNQNYAIELRNVVKSFKVGEEEVPVLKGVSTAASGAGQSVPGAWRSVG